MSHGERAKKKGNARDLWGKRPNKSIMPTHSKFNKKITLRLERREGKNLKDYRYMIML